MINKVFGIGMGLIVFGAYSLRAAPAQPSERSEDKTLVVTASVPWLKIYSITPYKERWRIELAVKNVDKDILRVRQIFTKMGAAVTHPPTPTANKTTKTQQLSYRCLKKFAQQSLLELKAVGTVTQPQVRPIVEPVALAEVQRKISLLAADQEGHAAELSRMPVASALVEELLGHLRSVEAALQKTDVEVLLNITIKEKP